MEDYHYKDHEDIVGYIHWLFKHNKETSLIIIAKKNREIVGFIAGDSIYYDRDLEKNVINIHELVVKPQYRGMGIATFLIYELINRAKQRNREKNKKVEHVCLWVGKNNQKAQKLYKNIGFSEYQKAGKWIKMIMKL